ncbi:MAG: TetR family transcriptional regulator [Parvibaculum sp.]|nr:TetR family transcriptional regulator [Parvibaculum sp.]
MSDAAATRRKPTQARALERVERILAAASDLIAETGSDAVKMTEVAERAGVPIGSLYQYFPDKAAILQTLAERIAERVRAGIAESLAGVATRDDALARMDRLLADYYALFLTEPVVRDIWSGTQSDKKLQELDITDSRANARVVADALKHLVPRKERARFETVCFLTMQLTGAAVRLAIAVDRKEGDRLMAEYRRMLRDEIGGFLTS